MHSGLGTVSRCSIAADADADADAAATGFISHLVLDCADGAAIDHAGRD